MAARRGPRGIMSLLQADKMTMIFFWTITEYHRSLTAAEKALVLPGMGNPPSSTKTRSGDGHSGRSRANRLMLVTHWKARRSRPVLFF